MDASVQYLAQEYFAMQNGAARDRHTSLPISRCPTNAIFQIKSNQNHFYCGIYVLENVNENIY